MNTHSSTLNKNTKLLQLAAATLLIIAPGCGKEDASPESGTNSGVGGSSKDTVGGIAANSDPDSNSNSGGDLVNSSGGGGNEVPELPTLRAKPNFVYILMDDMGIGDVSAYNPDHSVVSTPSIDALAAGGMRFTNAHTSSAVCSPTRYGLMLGEHPARKEDFASRVQLNYNDVWIDSSQRTVANVLQDAGYTTGYSGKWHLGYNVFNSAGEVQGGSSMADSNEPDWSQGVADHPYDRGFDWAFGHLASADMPPYKYFLNDQWLNLESDYKTRTEMIEELGIRPRSGWLDTDWDFYTIQRTIQLKAQEFITDRVEADRPFFLYVPLSAPHNPIVPHEDFQGKSKYAYTDYVLEADHIVGEIVRTLKEEGHFDNTLIIVTSDNGALDAYRKADHVATGVLDGVALRGEKTNSWEGGHRVPFIAHWGDGSDEGSVIKPGAITNDLVNLQDFYRTAAAIAEEPLAETDGVDSWNMLPLLLGDGTPQRLREANFSTSYDPHFVISKQYENGDEFKLIFGSGTGGWGQADVAASVSVDFAQDFETLDLGNMQLFNLDEDIGEENNLLADGLSSEEETVVRQLHTLLRGYMTSGRSNESDPNAVSLSQPTP